MKNRGLSCLGLFPESEGRARAFQTVGKLDVVVQEVLRYFYILGNEDRDNE